MASTSGQRSGAPLGKLRSVTGMLDSDNQSLIREIRKAMNLMKEVAVDLEKENMSDKVKDLETGLVEMLETSNDCLHFSNAIQSIGSVYEPGPETTDFKKLFDAEIRKSKAISPSQNHALLRQYREAVWNVHHAGQPMPGEEEDDIVMTSSACNLLNVTCPLSGKPVTELVEPVRSRECKHIFEKAAIMRHIKNARGRCPVAGCPKIVHANKVACDAFLLVEIDELRSMGKEAGGSGMVEDVTDLPEGAEEIDED